MRSSNSYIETRESIDAQDNQHMIELTFLDDNLMRDSLLDLEGHHVTLPAKPKVIYL